MSINNSKQCLKHECHIYISYDNYYHHFFFALDFSVGEVTLGTYLERLFYSLAIFSYIN